MYNVAIYINDYLVMLELMAKIDAELPTLNCTVFGDKAFKNSLGDELDSYVETDLSKLSEYEFLLIASPVSADKDGSIADFDGTIIDLTGYNFAQGAEVYKVSEPVRKILGNIAVPIADVYAVLQLPVSVFGKDGVDDLMEQTKDIFSFIDSESKVIKERIAFNIHFNPITAGYLIGKTIDDFVESGGKILVRLIPLSTVFTLDIVGKDVFGLKSDVGYIPVEGFFTAETVAEGSDIVVQPLRHGLSFAGDYIRIIVADMVEALKKLVN